MSFEAIVIGGNFAGLSAAMQLARARRRVLLVDAGAPRNRFSEASHGFLGQDGQTPAAIMREGKRQLSLYPTITIRQGKVVRAHSDGDAFIVGTEDGGEERAARVLLATGVRDTLPEIPASRSDGAARRCTALIVTALRSAAASSAFSQTIRIRPIPP